MQSVDSVDWRGELRVHIAAAHRILTATAEVDNVVNQDDVFNAHGVVDDKDKRTFKLLSTTGVYPEQDRSLGRTHVEKDRLRVTYLK